MRHRDIPAHLKAVRFLKKFVDKQAPTNSEIACAAGCVNGSVSYVLTRAIEGGFITIERSRGMRRFVFADGSKTRWTKKVPDKRSRYTRDAKREEFTDADAVKAIQDFWYSKGFGDVEVRVTGADKVRANLNKFGWPA